MKITQRQALEAYMVIRKLERQDMPGIYAKALFDAKKALEPMFQFQEEQETKLINQLGGEVDETGRITFPDDGTRAKYGKSIEELYAIENDLNFEKKKFSTEGLVLNVKDLESLDFIMDIVC